MGIDRVIRVLFSRKEMVFVRKMVSAVSSFNRDPFSIIFRGRGAGPSSQKYVRELNSVSQKSLMGIDRGTHRFVVENISFFNENGAVAVLSSNSTNFHPYFLW